MAKVLLGLAEGRKLHDKRAAIAARDWQRDKARLMRDICVASGTRGALPLRWA